MLVAIGVPECLVWSSTTHYKPERSREVSGPFWDRPVEYQWDMLERARRCWRHRIRACHADRGGDHESAVAANLLWRRIEQAFKRHGFELA